MADITLIQKTFRGYLARRLRARKIHITDGATADSLASNDMQLEDIHNSSSAESVAKGSNPMPRRLMAPPRTPPRGNSQKFAPQEILPQSVKKVEKVPFNKSFDLDIVVDGAMGLPLTTTMVRLRLELHMPTKEILELKSPFAYSELHSDYTNPQFSLRMQWPGTYTFSLRHFSLFFSCPLVMILQASFFIQR